MDETFQKLRHVDLQKTHHRMSFTYTVHIHDVKGMMVRKRETHSKTEPKNADLQSEFRG